MWLINTTSGVLTEFDNEDPPIYAILSHRWGAKEQEQTFKEYRKGLKQDTSGHYKILKLREIALADGYEWVWVDSACIDKRSSAELSEAINSMFTWAIWIITGIPESVLLDRVSYLHWTVAQKLSWAAGRRTKRIEDRAYSLLGLFHINMPLLYGEGHKAFRRLQIEILQKYSDESILAWQPPSSLANIPHEVLAYSPDEFAGSADMEPCLHPDHFGPESQRMQTELRVEDPPRPTSWGIEFRSHAHRLKPLTGKTIVVDGRHHQFLYAVTLTAAWAGKVRELPCVIILVQSGPAVLTYKRLACLPLSTEEALQLLRAHYVVGERLMDLRFYLRYDADFG
nr:hypothetical protein B0A51_12462 [Rachicladosporium sp. CCFEE 5018]